MGGHDASVVDADFVAHSVSIFFYLARQRLWRPLVAPMHHGRNHYLAPIVLSFELLMLQFDVDFSDLCDNTEVFHRSRINPPSRLFKGESEFPLEKKDFFQ